MFVLSRKFYATYTWAGNESENSLAYILCQVLITYQVHKIINPYTILSFVEACRKRTLFTDRSCGSVAPQFLLALPPALYHQNAALRQGTFVSTFHDEFVQYAVDKVSCNVRTLDGVDACFSDVGMTAVVTPGIKDR